MAGADRRVHLGREELVERAADQRPRLGDAEQPGGRSVGEHEAILFDEDHRIGAELDQGPVALLRLLEGAGRAPALADVAQDRDHETPPVLLHGARRALDVDDPSIAPAELRFHRRQRAASGEQDAQPRSRPWTQLGEQELERGTADEVFRFGHTVEPRGAAVGDDDPLAVEQQHRVGQEIDQPPVALLGGAGLFPPAHELGDVAAGAAVAPEPPGFVEQRLARDAQPMVAGRAASAILELAERLAAEHQLLDPLGHRPIRLARRELHPGLAVVPGRVEAEPRPHTLGQPSEAQLGVHLPEPVRGGQGEVLQAALGGLEARDQLTMLHDLVFEQQLIGGEGGQGFEQRDVLGREPARHDVAHAQRADQTRRGPTDRYTRVEAERPAVDQRGGRRRIECRQIRDHARCTAIERRPGQGTTARDDLEVAPSPGGHEEAVPVEEGHGGRGHGERSGGQAHDPLERISVHEPPRSPMARAHSVARPRVRSVSGTDWTTEELPIP